MKQFTAFLCALLTLTLCLTLPVSGAVPDADEIVAEAAVLLDAETGQMLYDKNAGERMYPASITKILTGLLVLETLEETTVVTASRSAVDTPAWGTNANIQAGEQMTVSELMYAMMLKSANEAANVLAEAAGGSLSQFADQMNQRARELGALDTHFSNAHGLPSRNHYTTARDMALITRAAVSTPGFLRYFGAGSYTMDATNRSPSRSFTNTHSMIPEDSWRYDEEVIGGKTGFTDQSGYTLATVARRGDRTLICIILDSEAIYADTEVLLEFGFAEFSSYTYEFEPGEPAAFPIWEEDREAGTVYVSTPDSASLLLHESIDPDRIRMELRYPEMLQMGEELEASAVLTAADQEPGLPGAILSVPLEVAVAAFDPPATDDANTLPAMEISGSRSLSPIHIAVVLTLASGGLCLVLFLSKRRQRQYRVRYRAHSRGSW